MAKRTYRTRPIRVSKSKKYTLADDTPATLLDWIRLYPMMTVNSPAWFSNWQIPHTELAECYEAGYHGVALALGYTPYAEAVPRNQQIDILRMPVVCAVGKVAA